MNTIVSSIINEFKLNDSQITNIYNYGSWVYGTNHEKSDRDFLFIMKIENETQRTYLKFQKDFDYFHSFKLHRSNNCDITIHTCENFELLLEKNYMLAVECIFYPNEFILRNNIDYKTIYLTKYYNPLRLKQVVFYENYSSLKYIIDNDEDDSNYFPLKSNSNSTINQLLCDAIHTTTIDEDRILKYLFHGLRYLDIGEQLIRTKSIYDFKRVSYVLFQLKKIFINNMKNIDFVIDYLKTKSDEYKKMINELVSTNTIDGTFKVHITVDNHNIEKFLNICKINNLKAIYIHLNDDDDSIKQLTTSSYHVGTYSDIVEQINTLIDNIFNDFDIQRLKIKSLGSNNGVPENDIDKLLFWDKKSNYFEFHYKIFIGSTNKLDKLKNLCRKQNLHLAYNTFEKPSINKIYYTVTMRLFNVGKRNAFITNDYIVQYLTGNDFMPLKVEHHFVVYDSNIDLDHKWSIVTSDSLRTNSTITRTGPRYRIGCKNRKVPQRSTE
ncbi:unnamed protein product [Rotaria sordida]|uniref:Polymerase nucleotidyl transferase domain-containing protein n=1 Tax=Rotaria sordida TaxID=392033 RepID=A0A819AQT5_9BILA|nr:unnamed protein product [Rotaria sordida]CAF3781038.1 unnamed protein product [Rotaria sordida]